MTISKILTNIICLLLLVNVKAQVNNIDSIENVLHNAKPDTAKVNLLLSTGRAIMFITPDKAFKYGQQALDIAKKIPYPLGLANAYRFLGAYFTDVKNDPETSMKYYHLADSVYHRFDGPGFKEGIGAILHSYGTIQLRQGNYVKAMQLLVRASEVLDSLNNKSILPKTYNNLAALYGFIGQYDKAEFYIRECIKLAEKTNDRHLISSTRLTLASILIEQKKFSEVLPNILKAKEISELSNDRYSLELCYLNMGNYYGFYKKDYKLAITYLKKGLELANVLGNSWEEAKILVNLSGFYYYSNQFEKALTSASKAYELASLQKNTDLKQRSLGFLAKAEVRLGYYLRAANHFQQALTLKDTVFSEENSKQINYLEALYQSEKKEKEILKLQSEKQLSELVIKRRNLLIYALFVTISLLAGIAFFIYRNIHNKSVIAEQDIEIQKHKILQLEKEKMLLATQSVLQGEEAERQRLSRDLHDGLGGLLFGTKIALNNMKNNVVLTSDSVKDFNHALGMIETSISELRRVAHNMMPEALLNLGLKNALNDLCAELDKINPVEIIFQFFGTFDRVDSNLEINAYRILQELVNNALKHSKAKKLVIQMLQEPDRLCFTVHDNGIGFDRNLIGDKKGLGLASVQSRVDFFKGIMEINSNPSVGTEITIEFPI